MRNHSQPTLETIQQFRDGLGSLWCVQLYYPNGKAKGNDRYWIGYLCQVGTTISIPCGSMSQLEHEVAIRRQHELF